MITKYDVMVDVLKRNGGFMEYNEAVEECRKELIARNLERLINKYFETDFKWFARNKSKAEFVVIEHGKQEYLALKDVVFMKQKYITPFIKKKPAKNSTESSETTKIDGTEVEIIKPKAEDFIPKNVPKYVPVNGEFDILMAHLESGIPVVFIGPKGTGKTLSIASFAYEHQVPLIQFDCSEDTRRQDLVGRFTIVDGEVKFILGVLPMAIEIANEYGVAILSLEELNALSPQMQKVLNQILDWRRHVYVPEIQKVYRLRDGARLLITGTMNPSTYGGVFELNEDLRSRFVEYHVNYPDKIHEKRILRELGIEIEPEEVLEGLLLLAKETRKGWQSGELNYALSTRDLVLLGELYNTYKKRMDTEDALKLVLNTIVNKYDDEGERETLRQRIESIFGIDMSVVIV